MNGIVSIGTTATIWVLLICTAGTFYGCASKTLAPINNGIDRGKCGDFEVDVERFWSNEARTEVKGGNPQSRRRLD